MNQSDREQQELLRRKQWERACVIRGLYTGDAKLALEEYNECKAFSIRLGFGEYMHPEAIDPIAFNEYCQQIEVIEGRLPGHWITYDGMIQQQKLWQSVGKLQKVIL